MRYAINFVRPSSVISRLVSVHSVEVAVPVIPAIAPFAPIASAPSVSHHCITTGSSP